MAYPLDIPQNFSSTLNVPGGINNSQTTGIIPTTVTGLPTDGGMLAFDWANPIDTTTIEYIEYGGISAGELTGVIRGQEGYTAKAHANACTIVGVVSRAHIKRLRDKLTGNDSVALQDPNQNEIVKTDYVASAVNELTIKNAATGNAPQIAATGGDTDIDVNIVTKGAGVLKVNGSALTSLFSTTSYAPQGFLLNGKISVTVASNNITVAIKGMDGNDPSSSNKVYCRIGDSVRTISAALSVTKNAGTNWFGAGGTMFATKEIDYFVYLGYNATDGVVIGFARIPFAQKYADFSTTTTNEKYCAISTTTNAASTDYYENIGRFAATLSATSSFNWSVPTFDAANLIQHPIYYTRKLTYAATITAPTLTIGSPVVNVADYKLIGSMCFVQIAATFNTSGTNDSDVIWIPPFTPVDATNGQSPTGGTFIGNTGAKAGMTWWRSGSSGFAVRPYDNSNWGNALTGAILQAGINFEI